MTRRPLPGAKRGRAPAVGFFGILGAGNIGNDASLEAMLRYLQRDHPGVVIDAMCSGPERVRAAYGINARSMHVRLKTVPGTGAGPANRRVNAIRLPGLLKIMRIASEAALSSIRLANWVRGHDVIIVPGAGILETTQFIRPWETPLELFVLSLAGRVFRTKVAFVCVGASIAGQRLTRRLYVSAARLAAYR